MKYTLVLITVFTLFIFISCGPTKQDPGKTEQVPAMPQNQEQPSSVDVEPNQPVEAETAEQPVVEQKNAEIMLNPPHGEPYHRCDIPVGAPLDSPPANTNRQTTNNQVQAGPSQNINMTPDIANNPTAPTIKNARQMNNSQTQNPVPANNGSKPRLNPPHGQPYHRCDIAVGSPLP